ncbi:hypothetical protein LOAG_18632, partial [Loa loa]
MAMVVIVAVTATFRSTDFSRRKDNYDSNVKEAHRGCHKIKSTDGCTTTGKAAVAVLAVLAAVAVIAAVAVLAVLAAVAVIAAVAVLAVLAAVAVA